MDKVKIIKKNIRKSQFDYFLRLGNDREVIIGDIDSADLKINDESVSRDNVVLRWLDNNLTIKSFISDYDVTINGKVAQSGEVIGDKTFFNLGDFWFYYDNKKIYFDKAGIDVGNNDVSPVVKNTDFNYPLFIRNTRQKIKENNEPIAVLDPPAKPNKPASNIITSLLPAIAMFGVTFVLRGMMGNSGSFAVFAGLSMGVGILSSVAGIVVTRVTYKKDCKKRKEDYSMYSRRKEEEIIQCRKEELNNLRETYYSIEEDVRHFKDFDSSLFDRIPDDEDFVDVYLGTGKIESKRQIDFKHQETMDSEDNIAQIPMNLATQYRYIEKAPIVLKLRDANVVGVVGAEENTDILIENIIIDLMARQYYGDIDIYFLMDKEDESKFDWIRLLPYFNNDEGIRTIVNDNDSKNFIFEYLYKQLSYRQANQVGGKHNIVLVKKEHGIKSHPISRFIENSSELNTSFIFFEEKEDLLPLYCSFIVKVTSSDTGCIYSTSDKNNQSTFKFQQVNDVAKKMLMERIAPIKIEDISLDNSLRKSVSLFELLQISEVDDIELAQRWGESKIFDSMAVPLGVNVKDEVVYLDLHEKYHGPHGLVAGTTGSGKSEILQSYILGAASLFSPTEIGFLVIDFKGGGMVNQFKDLPHLLGAITNIDGKEIDRSLKSIKAELLKRQELFAEANVNNIDKYIKLYKDNKVSVPLPHLIIIVDEFAELKAEQPDFMKELISAARIGRSLGVHLILATQKPSGQVDDQIWSNSKFKLCLKVQTQEDSNEVLKSPLAAEIKEPGRAYLQVGNNEIFELFQSGYSGAPEKVDTSQKNYTLYNVDYNGTKSICYNHKSQNGKGMRSQLVAIVDYIRNYCDNNNVAVLDNICLPPLKNCVLCNEIKIDKCSEMACPIGIYDNPDYQYQGEALSEIALGNTFIIGSAQYGKTNLLSVIVKNLASIYSPKEVNIYILDFASMILKNLEQLNHVGGVVVPSDEERIKNLFKYLYEQIEFRRNKLLEVGVSSFVAYKEAGYSDLPQIVVLVDNLTVLKELYFEQNDELLPLTREGLSVGISFVVANATTGGIGYRYMANFANKIALFCNDESEYSTLLGRTRLYPDEIPGRALIEIDKKLFECQTYLAFEGEKEIERVENMKKFIEDSNERFKGIEAIPIPEIPELLTSRIINERFIQKEIGQLIAGLDYDTVAPDVVEFSKNNCISICGRDYSGKANIIKYFVRYFQEKTKNAKVYIIDDYKRKLDSVVDSNAEYTISSEKVNEVVTNLYEELQHRYNSLANNVEFDHSFRVIVINNEDALLKVSNDKETMDALKTICSKYKILNAVVILGKIPNEQVLYSAPEIYKFVKEYPNMFFFEELNLCKIYDVPINTLREKSKRLSLGDAYHIEGATIKRIKTPLLEEK